MMRIASVPARTPLLLVLACCIGALACFPTEAAAGFRFGGVEVEDGSYDPLSATRVTDSTARGAAALRLASGAASVTLPADALAPGSNMLRVRARAAGCVGPSPIVLSLVDGVPVSSFVPARTWTDDFFHWVPRRRTGPAVVTLVVIPVVTQAVGTCPPVVDLDAVWFSKHRFAEQGPGVDAADPTT